MVNKTNKRLNNIIDNLNEVINSLNANIDLLDSEEEEDIKLLEAISKNYRDKLNIYRLNTYKAFRADIVNLFSSIEEYIACSLKTVNISVSSKTIRNCLDSCLSEHIITTEFYNIHRSSLRFRNNIAHRYNEPTSEELVEWWRSSKNYYIDFINNLNGNQIKDMNIF